MSSNNISETGSSFEDRGKEESNVIETTSPTLEEQQTKIDQLAAEYGINQKKLMLKLDLHIVPAICLLYLLAFLDRVNISNANVYGLAKDLNLHGNQYNIALTVFFVPYILSEIPSNYFLKKLNPHVWLSGCMVLFGAVTLAQGFVKNFGGLVVCRVFLGMSEAGMFPGCFYLLSMWYRREEAQRRYSFFFSSTCLAGGFSGLIAAGIWNLNGKRGLEGWRWIFIIEGAITIFCSALMFFCISDFPEDARYLSENERAFIKAKLALDSGDSSHDVPLDAKSVFRVFKEWKIWVIGLMYFFLIVPSYGYAYFAATIVKSLKYSAIQTQFHSVPPWVAAFGFSMISAIASDKTRHRAGYAIFSCLVAIAGFIMLLANHTNIHVRYGGLFLIASGLYTAMPLLVCWTNMNFAGHHRRSVGTGWQIGFGNIGGIIATFSFLSTDGPFYTKGLTIGLVFTICAIVTIIGYELGLIYENRQKRLGLMDERYEKMSEIEKKVAGDLKPSFIYQY
ncbi:hypothetical protein D0Z00_003752 [Geotrichum galactomycetum]|uniref:Uncharacterized protein n=1 Tax=Geotrichum galactomycetum TaxID=27317 RepID=A0ACB6V0C4_9ASCO|nr:hypothetical protein D0Z00_003752 [Geotrichum candidum]